MKNKVFALGISISCMAGQAFGAGDFAAAQKQLGVPTSVGTVVDASGKHPQFILIQDVHRHPEAQENIAAMILHGLSHWGTKELFIEGAWADRDIPRDSKERFPSLHDAVRNGKLGGAEMAASLAPNKNFRFQGLEDPETYKENVAAFQAVENVRQEALRELETARMLDRIADASDAPSWNQIQRLIQLRLKPGEYAEYLQHPFHPTPDTALATAVQGAERFYQLADQRSRVFLANAQSMHRSGTQVLVVGGFHTTEMAKELREKGISFVVLAPRITQGGFEELYANGMHETVSALKLQ